jgi:hypothetical protein
MHGCRPFSDFAVGRDGRARGGTNSLRPPFCEDGEDPDRWSLRRPHKTYYARRAKQNNSAEDLLDYLYLHLPIILLQQIN